MKRVIKSFDPITLMEGEIKEAAENTEGGHVATLRERIKERRERLAERKIEAEKRMRENRDSDDENDEDYEGEEDEEDYDDYGEEEG
jgi:hypothetical protein